MKKFFSLASLTLFACMLAFVSVRGQGVTLKVDSSSMTPALANDMKVLVANIRDDSKHAAAAEILERQFGDACLPGLRTARAFCDDAKLQKRYDMLITKINTFNPEIEQLVIELRDNSKWEHSVTTLSGKFGNQALLPLWSAFESSPKGGVVQQRCGQAITRIVTSYKAGIPSGIARPKTEE